MRLVGAVPPQRDAVEHAGLSSQKKQTSWSATLYASDTKQEAYVVYELQAPRPIKRLRMGGDLWLTDGGNQVRYLYRCYNGSSWGSWRRTPFSS